MGVEIEHYKKGLKLYGDGKHLEAIEEYDKGLALKPDWPDLLQAKGMAQMNAGKHDEALATLQRVAELAPEDPLAFTSLSMAWLKKENIEEAEKAQAKARLLSWKEELKTNPDARPPEPPPGEMHVKQ